MEQLAQALAGLAVGGQQSKPPQLHRKGCGRTAGGGPSVLHTPKPPPVVRSSPYGRPSPPRGSRTDSVMTDSDDSIAALTAAIQSLALGDAGSQHRGTGPRLCPGGCGRRWCTPAELFEEMERRCRERGCWASGGEGDTILAVAGASRAQHSVPWRACATTVTPGTPRTTSEGEMLHPGFVFVAPDPRGYEDESAEPFTLFASSTSGACAARAAQILECRFKAWWESAHLLSLGGPAAPAHRARMPFTMRLMARLGSAAARTCDGAPPSDLCRPRPEHRHLQRRVFLIDGPRWQDPAAAHQPSKDCIDLD
eukprot:TRINITY_DN46995_c0_g1_i1.p1 TRINITY_DN46995_c0_g1~~TRINITY_DN46995_c0_g1_i1.p1  ORF type:complete len:350 (+),score=71.35 TRINITY_DN46995_c0_g1_i1:122-1051(+)